VTKCGPRTVDLVTEVTATGGLSLSSQSLSLRGLGLWRRGAGRASGAGGGEGTGPWEGGCRHTTDTPQRHHRHTTVHHRQPQQHCSIPRQRHSWRNVRRVPIIAIPCGLPLAVAQSLLAGKRQLRQAEAVGRGCTCRGRRWGCPCTGGAPAAAPGRGPAPSAALGARSDPTRHTHSTSCPRRRGPCPRGRRGRSARAPRASPACLYAAHTAHSASSQLSAQHAPAFQRLSVSGKQRRWCGVSGEETRHGDARRWQRAYHVLLRIRDRCLTVERPHGVCGIPVVVELNEREPGRLAGHPKRCNGTEQGRQAREVILSHRARSAVRVWRALQTVAA